METVDIAVINNIMVENRIKSFYSDIEDEGTDNTAIAIFHIDDWDHGFCKSNDANIGDYHTRRQFYKDFFDMMRFLDNYILLTGNSKCIVSSFNREYQFHHNARYNGKDIYEEIHGILTKAGIRRKRKHGLLLDTAIVEEKKVLEAVFEGAFCGVSLLSVFLLGTNELLVPTHHMEIVFYSYSDEQKMRILEAKKNLSGIIMAETTI